MHSGKFICAAALAVFVVCANAQTLREKFQKPDKSNRPYTMWWMNGPINDETIDTQLTMLEKNGFGGITPLPLRRQPPTEPHYPMPEYFEAYEKIVKKIKQLGMQMIFYDDSDFPSGTAGSRMENEFRGSLHKELWQGKMQTTGGRAELPAPEGKLQAVFSYTPSTKKLKEITKEVSYEDAPQEEWRPSEGAVDGASRGVEENYLKKKIVWKKARDNAVMLAYVSAEIPRAYVVDYFSPEAVKNFMSITYDKMAEVLDGKGYWGDVIKSTFFDDLSVYGSLRNASWNPYVAEQFKKTYGISPERYYPYMFYDSGVEDNAKAGAARAMIHSVRGDVFASTYPGTTQKWAQKRGMTAAGHPAGSYENDPMAFSVDAIKFYKYAGAVLMDSIHRKDLAVKGAKIPTSAAVNYDHATVYCEIYGNFNPPEENDGLMLYRGAIDMFARGCNSLITHGTWLNADRVDIIPEISWRNPKMASDLPGYTEWVGRVQTIMQGGANTADVAILYPIRTIQAHYRFTPQPLGRDNEYPYVDYRDIGAIMTDDLKRGFHFLHPEVLAQKCSAQDGTLNLPGKRHPQKFKALILPYCEYMNLDEMQKVKEFHDAGGLVIATETAPEKSANVKVKDSQIREISDAIFKSGNGIVVKDANAASLKKALDSKGIAWNYFGENSNLGADIACIHYVKDGRDFYFVGNASKEGGRITMKIKGDGDWEYWNPHMGDASKVTPKKETVWDTEYSVFELNFEPGKSVFISRKAQDQIQ